MTDATTETTAPVTAPETPATPATTLLTTDATTPEGATTPAEAAPPAGSEGSEAAPESTPPEAAEPVAYALTAPEGYELTPETTEQITTLLRESGVAPDKAQALVDFHAQAVVAAKAAALQAYADQVETWKAATLADPEIGGAKWEAAKADAMRAVHALGGQPLQDALEQTAAGTHPVILRALVQVGRQLAEDTAVRAGAGGASAPSIAQRLFPSMT